MGRKVRTDIPQLEELFIPDWPYLEVFRAKDKNMKEEQKAHYNHRKRAMELPLLPIDTPVWSSTGLWDHSTASSNSKVIYVEKQLGGIE